MRLIHGWDCPGTGLTEERLRSISLLELIHVVWKIIVISITVYKFQPLKWKRQFLLSIASPGF